MENIQELDNFYKEKFYMSYSSISKLLYSPVSFYNHYILKEKKDYPENHLLEGKIIHCLLLNPESFGDNYMLSPSSLPSASNKKIIDTIFNKVKTHDTFLNFNLTDNEEIILDVLKEFDLHQSLKTDKQRIEKVINDESLNYFYFLRQKESKILVDIDTYTKCFDYVSVIRENQDVNKIMNIWGMNPGCITYNELSLQSDIDGYDFGLKGIIDNLVIDEYKRVITINDLKTTSKTLSEFKESIEYFNYWLQASIYYYLVQNNFKYQGDWNIEFNYIVIDKHKQLYVFAVSKETLTNWNLRFRNALDGVNYHYSTKDYTLPYEYATKRIVL